MSFVIFHLLLLFFTLCTDTYMKCMYSLVSERTVPVRHSLSPPLCNEITSLLNPGVQTDVLVLDFSKEQSKLAYTLIGSLPTDLEIIWLLLIACLVHHPQWGLVYMATLKLSIWSPSCFCYNDLPPNIDSLTKLYAD